MSVWTCPTCQSPFTVGPTHKPPSCPSCTALRSALKRAEEALRDAASSLEALALSGARDSNITDLMDVRGYAGSRAREARAYFDGKEPG